MNKCFLLLLNSLSVLFLCLAAPITALASQHPSCHDSPLPLLDAQHPCNIYITGDFESECIIPFLKDGYYNEDPNSLIACQGMKVRYTAHFDLGDESVKQWTWSVVGEESYYVDNEGCIIVEWGNEASGQLSVLVYGSEGTSCSKSFNVELIEKPTISIRTIPPYVVQDDGSKVIYVCKGETVEFSDVSYSSHTDIVGYFWKSNLGGISSSPNYSIDYIWDDDVVIHRVYNNCGCFDEEKYNIRILNGNILDLDCYGTVCQNNIVSYKASSPNCNQYFWHVDGGSVLSGQYSPSVSIQWDNPHNGYGIISLDGNLCGDNACPHLMSKKVPVIHNDISITGDNSPCVGDAVVYSIPLFGSTSYNWNISPSSGVRQSSLNGANEQVLIFDQPGLYSLSVSYNCSFLDCDTFFSTPLSIYVKPKLSISGEERICISNPCFLSTSPSSPALWTVFDIDNSDQIIASYPSLSSLSMTFPHKGKYKIVASNDNFCNNAEFFLSVEDTPPPPSLSDFDPTNPHSSCKNSGILLKANPVNPNYTIVWKKSCDIDNPLSLSGNEVTVNYGNSICDLETFTYDRVLGCLSSQSFVHSVSERLPKAISIPHILRVCPGTKLSWNNNQVPFQEGFLYKWELQENMQHCASIQGNAFSNNITLAINNLESESYPAYFFLKLERKYCNSIVFDTIYFIVDTHAPNNVAILSDTDTACAGSIINFSHSPSSNSSFCWWADDDRSLSYENTFSHSFISPGNHYVYLRYNNFDYCNNSHYFDSTSLLVHILPLPYSDDIHIDENLNIVYLTPPSSSNLSYQWLFNNVPMEGETEISTAFIGDGCYGCNIVNVETGCKSYKSTCTHSDKDTCIFGTWDSIAFDSCSASLFLRPYPINTPIHWSVEGGPYLISHPSGNTSEAVIQFQKNAHYVVYATSYEDTCISHKYTINIPFIHSFSFEPNCSDILILNNSLSNNDSTPIVISINDSILVSFLARDRSFSFLPSHNGLYSFHLLHPYYCDLGSFFFELNNDSLLLSSSNGNSSPVSTCNNIPLKLTASLLSGASIDSTLWKFSDGSYFMNQGDSFYHTFSEYNFTYTVSATVKSTNGCIISNSIDIISYDNPLHRGGLNSSSQLVCPYVSQKLLRLLFRNNLPDIENFTYQWNIGDYPHSYIRPTYFTSNYTVMITDNHLCKDHYQKDVIFKTRPTAIIIADKYKCCIGDRVYLFGAPDPDSSDNSFSWHITSPDGNTITNSSASTSFVASLQGSYSINLHLTNSQGCSADATPVSISVLPAPDAPSLGYGSRLCLDNPPVELVEIPTPLNDDDDSEWYNGSPNSRLLHWSNGSTGNSAFYFYPGVATAWYLNTTTGCKSKETPFFIDAQPNFDAVLSGCYEKCASYFSKQHSIYAWGITPISQSINFNWFLNDNIIHHGFGNFGSSPLSLPLYGFGKYFLDVDFNNNNCNSSSPALIISEKKECFCDNLDVNVVYKMDVSLCHLVFDVDISICNNNNHLSCLSKLEYLFPENNISVAYSNFITDKVLAPGECYNFTMQLNVSHLSPSHIVSFRLHDYCNKCYTDFSLNLLPNESDCQLNMNLSSWEIVPEWSNSSSFYFAFNLNLPSLHNLLSLDATPDIIFDYNFNSNTSLSGLLSLDYALLSQLLSINDSICLYAFSCKDNLLCKLSFCIPASYLYISLLNNGFSFDAYNSSASSSSNSKKSLSDEPPLSSSPSLSPNPSSGFVKVVGYDGILSEVKIFDMNGIIRDSFSNTDALNISQLPSGAYVVRIETLNNNQTSTFYLKLIKQ